MALTGLLFALMFLLGCLMALVRHPIYGLMTYVGAFYLHPPSRWWGQGILLDVRWSLIAAGVTLAALILRPTTRPSIPLFSHRVTWGLLLFLCWIVIQFAWVIDPEQHRLLVEYYVKYLVVVFLIYRCVDSEQNLRLFLWSHVLGCFYFGWIAFTTYTGGRFEGFGGPGLSEANAAALTMVTAAMFGGSLFLVSAWRQRVLLVGLLAIIINGVVTTISRSGFLSLLAGGIVYNLFTPPRYAKRVRVLSILGLVLFALLTNPVYWARIQSLKYKGQEVEGVDTGAGRIDIMKAQLEMFRDRPLGCGHFCTEILSPQYLDASRLNVGTGRRASHNTFLSMLVDQGFVGAACYVLMLLWVFLALRALMRQHRNKLSFQATVLPAIAASVGALTVADMFVPYVRYEVRFWFIALIMVLLNFAKRERDEMDARLPDARG